LFIAPNAAVEADSQDCTSVAAEAFLEEALACLGLGIQLDLLEDNMAVAVVRSLEEGSKLVVAAVVVAIELDLGRTFAEVGLAIALDWDHTRAVAPQ
jgi:hypothetical protein